MPPLATLLKTQSLPGFEAIENMPTPEMTKPEGQAAQNPYLRCPLPPFSTTVDTIRQWNMTGKVPVMRVIPLPTQQGAGGGASSSVTNVVEESSGSSSTSGTTSLTPVTFLVPVPALLPGGFFQTTLRVSQSFQPIGMLSTQPLEVRMYSNPTTRSIDQTRPTDVAVSFAQIEGVISDVVMDTVPYSWTWENRIASNADSPQTVNLYLTIVNPSSVAATSAGRVTIILQPLET